MFSRTGLPSYAGITNETYVGAERRQRGGATLEGARVSSTREPAEWTPAHASKAARVNQLPAALSSKRTAAFGSAPPGAWGVAVCRQSSGLPGQFRDNLGGTRRARKSRSRLYLASRRGEVAERLKAAVC